MRERRTVRSRRLPLAFWSPIDRAVAQTVLVRERELEEATVFAVREELFDSQEGSLADMLGGAAVVKSLLRPTRTAVPAPDRRTDV